MFERHARRVFTKKHSLPELYGRLMARAGPHWPPVERHEVHLLYRRFAGDGVGPTKLLGKTSHFTVAYESSLGPVGLASAQCVLEKCEQDYKTLSSWFKVAPPHFNVVVASVSEGGLELAYHDTCQSTDLICDAGNGVGDPADYTVALVAAEVTEVFEALQHKGWNCAAANGEALSRVLAVELHPGALDHHSVAPAWLDHDRVDVVNRNYPTDTNPVANGCGVLFLNWLHYQLGYGWDQIVQAAAPTLAITYQLLTGLREDPFPRFLSLLDAQLPRGRDCQDVPDNPFPLTQQKRQGSTTP